jgi:hypothetical protein
MVDPTANTYKNGLQGIILVVAVSDGLLRLQDAVVGLNRSV